MTTFSNDSTFVAFIDLPVSFQIGSGLLIAQTQSGRFWSKDISGEKPGPWVDLGRPEDSREKEAVEKAIKAAEAHNARMAEPVKPGLPQEAKRKRRTKAEMLAAALTEAETEAEAETASQAHAIENPAVETIMEAAAGLLKAEGPEALKAVLAEFGLVRARQCPEEKRADFLDALNAAQRPGTF